MLELYSCTPSSARASVCDPGPAVTSRDGDTVSEGIEYIRMATRAAPGVKRRAPTYCNLYLLRSRNSCERDRVFDVSRRGYSWVS